MKTVGVRRTGSMRVLQVLALLAAIAVALVAWRDYREGQVRLAIDTAGIPAAISADVGSQSAGWSWNQTSAGRPRVAISAGGFRQDRNQSGIELTGVRLEIQHPGAGTYDRVTTDAARFDSAQSLFYSEGRVVVTLGLPVGETLSDESAFTRIVTSGATFNTESGEVWTDRPAEYTFDGGSGSSVGARYSSLDRRFTMISEALVERRPASSGGTKTVIRAGKLDYFEARAQVHLAGGCSLLQGTYRVDAESADVFLNDGAIHEIMATRAIGASRGEARTVRFETPFLRALYSPGGWVETVVGEGHTRLQSTSKSTEMVAEGEWIQLRYAAEPGETDSRLTDGDIVGAARIEATSHGAAGGAGDRIVESESIHLKMRPGGTDVAFMETMESGRIVIAPDDGAGASETRLDGNALRVDYAPGNRMERLTANGEVVLVDDPVAEGKPPLRSWSESLIARFDPATEDLMSLSQTGGSRFEQGAQRGRGTESLYEPLLGRFTFTGEARVDQPGVTVSADKITMTEETGRLDAIGNVAAQYQDDEPVDGADGLFADGEPIFAAAERMISGERKGLVVYEGHARLWQKENRVEAERIAVDQVAATLEAKGAVRSRLRGSEPGAVPTLVSSDELLYREEAKTASYSGSVALSQADLRVRGEELDAVIEGDDGAELESAEVRGNVEIIQVVSGRKGFGTRAVYEPGAGQVLLMGDPARAENADGEETRGARLTYRLDVEALLVEGDAEPAYTVQRQKSN